MKNGIKEAIMLGIVKGAIEADRSVLNELDYEVLKKLNAMEVISDEELFNVTMHKFTSK